MSSARFRSRNIIAPDSQHTSSFISSRSIPHSAVSRSSTTAEDFCVKNFTSDDSDMYGFASGATSCRSMHSKYAHTSRRTPARRKLSGPDENYQCGTKKVKGRCHYEPKPTKFPKSKSTRAQPKIKSVKIQKVVVQQPKWFQKNNFKRSWSQSENVKVASKFIKFVSNSFKMFCRRYELAFIKKLLNFSSGTGMSGAA